MTHWLRGNGDYTPAHCPDCGQTFVMYDNGTRCCWRCGRELVPDDLQEVYIIERKMMRRVIEEKKKESCVSKSQKA